MDRDCNIENLSYRTTDGGTVIRLSDLQDWMTDKKIVKKGLHPHPYADVLHEWIEGAEAQFSINGQWIEFSDANEVYAEVRIKPSEPVYEWQWLDINPINHKAFFINEAKFMIEEECNTYTCYTIPIKIEDVHIDEQGCEEAFYLYEMASLEYIYSLEATIKAQEITIRDKTVFMEAMAQPKTCDGCVELEYWKKDYYPMGCHYCIRKPRVDDNYKQKVKE